MANFNLSEHIIFEILSQLPVKSVLRFKSVCRNWYDLVTTPLFTQNHLKAHDRAFSAILAFNYLNRSCLRVYPSESLDKHVNIDFPTLTAYDQYRLIGICDGLIYLLASNNSVVIFNPLFKEYWATIPPSNIPVKHQDIVFWGLHSCEDNSYELTRIVYNDSPQNNKVIVRAETYTLGANSWREIDVNNTVGSLSRTSCIKLPTLLWGKLYWGSSDSTVDKIVCFDISRQVFYEISLPSGTIVNYWDVFIWKKELAIAIGGLPGCFNFWVFSENDNEWTMKLTIDWSRMTLLKGAYRITIMGCGRNGELIFKCYCYAYNKVEVLLRNPVSKEIKRLPCADVAAHKELIVYTESLVSRLTLGRHGR